MLKTNLIIKIKNFSQGKSITALFFMNYLILLKVIIIFFDAINVVFKQIHFSIFVFFFEGIVNTELSIAFQLVLFNRFFD